MNSGSFRYLNRFIVFLWRLGLGRFLNVSPRYLGRMLVLGITGRKSGQLRWTPLNYAPGAPILGPAPGLPDNAEVFCVAGFGASSQWYQNLLVHPQVEVWLPEGCWRGLAETVTDPDMRRRGIREVLRCSGFAAKLFGGIDLPTISESDLARQTSDYILVRIRLLQHSPEDAGLYQEASLLPDR